MKILQTYMMDSEQVLTLLVLVCVMEEEVKAGSVQEHVPPVCYGEILITGGGVVAE